MFRTYLLNELVKKNIIQYGDFTLKSGEKSNVYINLKNLISYPNLMAGLCTFLSKVIYPKTTDYVLCGVPMGGIPLSTTISMITGKPQILLRNDRKSYGTKKRVEGDGNIRDVVLIEDVVTTGSSVKEAVDILYDEGFNVIQVLSIVYRGKAMVPSWLSDLKYHYVFHMNEFNPRLKRGVTISLPSISDKQKEVLERIEMKKSNIVLACDTVKPNYLGRLFLNLMKILDIVHPHIVGLKVHNEILGLSDEENKRLYETCQRYNVFLWEDRKFNDIGNTIQNQIKYYEPIRDYVSIVPTSGKDALNCKTTLGKFVLCEMSSKNNLFNSITTNGILSMISDDKHGVAGIICQSPELFNLGIPTLMPGINLKKGTDGLGQVWNDPTKLKNKPNMYVIGRAILEAEDPIQELIKYKDLLFKKII